MDHVTIAEREQERQRMEREARGRQDQAAHHEVETSREELKDDIGRGRERGWRAGWGDFRSWAWIFFFAFIVMGAMWVLCVLFAGNGTQTHWHLGFPPTRPD
ncbi:MAG: hypothetical protein LC772_01575 [Chloroflexi bacterium]|nr:hypothetical protein [Chloroflexota bacterium]